MIFIGPSLVLPGHPVAIIKLDKNFPYFVHISPLKFKSNIKLKIKTKNRVRISVNRVYSYMKSVYSYNYFLTLICR